MRFVIFGTVGTLLTVGITYYVGNRHIPYFRLTDGQRTLAWIILSLIAFLVPLAMSARFWMPATLRDVIQWPAFILMGAFAVLFVGTVLRDLIYLVLKLLNTAGLPTLPADPSRRDALLAMSSGLVLGGSALTTLLGVRNARTKPDIVEVKLPIQDLPAELDGFSIVQITDVHVGPTIKKDFIQPIVDAINSLQADVVALTGDLVDGSVPELAEHVAPLKNIKARYGSFYVTGNHEYYSGALEWIDAVNKLGFTTLLNEHRTLDVNGKKIVMAGVTDYNAEQIIPDHKSDPQKAIEGAPNDAVKILLAHQPRSLFAAQKAGFHVQLSGHTHGGQIWPWNFLVPLQQPLVAGLHLMDSLLVYVSRGTGYWGPPVRLAAPSEITRLILTRA